ncbi:hypothetical protein DFQ05_0516 [Winogradskyella wandonensis]|uniref:Tetratricopeptide repeat protein n=1 Tax=Winogradskyella wandonensis TaxID=1442586 RepID=A0A4R1KUZ5_9FLAO|nr:hypothetical protein [Winogradskyella wandonensis]TCK69005.1 hypothetical protein DFQ05_0516 [Winogradskyella wandonensis]
MEEQSSKQKWIKTLKFLAAYLVAAWTFLQFIDWVLNRYDISPNWVDLLLWVFVGVIPSVLIYFYNQDRINDGILKLREKIIFPLNLILLAVITYLGFGNSDLGATTKEISYTNDAGNLATQVITKEEFRVGLPIYAFEAKTQDTAFSWLQDGIQELLYQDLSQDKSISPYMSDSEGIVNKVAEARIFNEYYLDGTYEVTDSVFKIIPTIRNAKNGKILKQQTFEGKDLLNLLDDISIFTKSNIGLTENMRDFYIDLNLKDFYSNSLEAVKYNIEGDYQKAQEADSTFAISYFENAFRFIRYSFGEESEKELINKAYKYSNKLPLQKQLQIRILRHIAYEEWEIAEKLIKLQLEIDPSNETYNQLLYAVYGETKQTRAFAKHAQDRFDKNKSIDNGTNLINASLVSGNYDEIISAIKGLELIQPDNPDLFTFKLRPQLLKGDIKAAKKTQERTKLMHPQWKNFTPVFDSVIDYLSENKITVDKLEKFVGKYRYQGSEQTYDYWIEDDRLLTYVSNQQIYAPILAGDYKVILSGYITRNINHIEFLTDSIKTIYGTKNINYSYKDPSYFYYWLYDKSIEDAENALKNNELDKAELLYKQAIDKHPNHFFLKLALQHITYVKSTSEKELIQQYQNVSGNYSARRFWIENNQLYYERQGATKLRLYPISENRYISLARYSTQYTFEETESGKLASAVYTYNNETKTWSKDMENNNYLLKDD